MKTHKIFRGGFLLLFGLLFLACGIFAQDTLIGTPDPVFDPPFDTETPNVRDLTDFYNMVLGGLVLLWGYIARAFKLDVKFNEFVFVVIAGAITLAGVFIHWGFADGIQSAITILATMGIFDLLKGASKQVNRLRTTKE